MIDLGEWIEPHRYVIAAIVYVALGVALGAFVAYRLYREFQRKR